MITYLQAGSVNGQLTYFVAPAGKIPSYWWHNELVLLSRLFPPGGRVLDNHARK
jgi:hypothetical protein